MPDEAIAAAHEQAVEQVMSDERLLGVLPDDLSQTLLDWVSAQIGRAAQRAPSVEAFWNATDAIRHQARTIADASADAGDDATALIARLRSAESRAVDTPSAPGAIDQQPTIPVTGSATKQLQAPGKASRPIEERETTESETATAPTPPPAATNRDVEPPSEPAAQSPTPVAPRRTRPNFVRSLWLSLRRTYGRLRVLLWVGGSR